MHSTFLVCNLTHGSRLIVIPMHPNALRSNTRQYCHRRCTGDFYHGNIFELILYYSSINLSLLYILLLASVVFDI